MCVYTQSKGTTRWRALVNRMIMKQRVKYEQIKKKTCSVCFVNVIRFRENKFKIVQKNFQEIIVLKRFLGKANGHNDKYGWSKTKD